MSRTPTLPPTEPLMWCSLSPFHADRLISRVEETTPGLLKVLWARWEEDLEAIRGEGRS
jgi:hypothetical protein